MMIGYPSRTLFEPLTPSVSVNAAAKPATRLGLTLIITLIVVSSPIVMFISPAPVAASATSNPGDTPATPSTISQDGSDFTAQATLSSLTARPTNNIVNTNSFYDVVFLTASSGAIKTIEVTFPAGTTIPSGAFFNEAEGIGPGTVSKSGQTITYTVTNAVNVPVGTKIRLEFANINNPLQVSASYTVTVTTRDAANAIIDGPSQSAAYTIKQIGVNAIADNSITRTKPAESFMKRVTIFDNAAGHAVGWDPDGASTLFTIDEPGILGTNLSFVIVEVADTICVVDEHSSAIGIFRVRCQNPPSNNTVLHYVAGNLPGHIVQ